jgi:hypothetical protein
VVGANSLVLSNIPAGCTAIGVPAKLLPVIFRCSLSPACAPSAEPDDAADRVRGSHGAVFAPLSPRRPPGRCC